MKLWNKDGRTHDVLFSVLITLGLVVVVLVVLVLLFLLRDGNEEITANTSQSSQAEDKNEADEGASSESDPLDGWTITSAGSGTNSTEASQVSEDGGEVEYELVYTESTYDILYVKNNAESARKIEAELVYYLDDKPVDTYKKSVFTVGAGKTSVVFLYKPKTEYSDIKVSVAGKKPSVTDQSDQLSFTSNVGAGESVIVELKNDGDEEIGYYSMGVIFYKDGKVIGGNSKLGSKFAAGDSETIKLRGPNDLSYKKMDYDAYDVFVHYAYRY